MSSEAQKIVSKVRAAGRKAGMPAIGLDKDLRFVDFRYELRRAFDLPAELQGIAIQPLDSVAAYLTPDGSVVFLAYQDDEDGEAREFYMIGTGAPFMDDKGGAYHLAKPDDSELTPAERKRRQAIRQIRESEATA